MVDRIRWDTVSYLPFYYVFFQFLLLTIFNLQANILTTKDILSNLASNRVWRTRSVIVTIDIIYIYILYNDKFIKKNTSNAQNYIQAIIDINFDLYSITINLLYTDWSFIYEWSFILFNMFYFIFI